MQSQTESPLGLIAGQGRFPFLVAKARHRARHTVAAIGLKGLADPALREHVDRFRWSGIVRLGRGYARSAG